MTSRPTRRHAVAACAATTALLGVSPPVPDEPTPEGRDPTRSELHPSVEAAFPLESYAPGSTAKLVISNRARELQLRIFRSGRERILTRTSTTMNGVPVGPTTSIGASDGRLVVRVRVGPWPSGLYFARLVAADHRVGFAPFVVRPRRLGEYRVAVVLPTLTWQAYNLRDENGDGQGDSWYASWHTRTIRLGRPHLSRGVPFNFFRYDLPFLRWLARTGKDVDMLAQSDLESVPSARALARAYDLVVFLGHHEYVTGREFDIVERYRDLGGNLMFLSANNFFWKVVRKGDLLTWTRLWRDLGRPEAAFIGVQYLANGKASRRPWLVRSARANSWVFFGTTLGERSGFARGGVEIDHTTPASPRGVQVLAEIPHLFGRGQTAQMTYYQTPRGAKVFAAGAFYLTRLVPRDPVVARILENLWLRLARP